MLYENEILKVDSFLVELIAFGAEFEEVTGYYGYSLEEMLDACRFIEITPFKVLMEMLEEAALLREEEDTLSFRMVASSYSSCFFLSPRFSLDCH